MAQVGSLFGELRSCKPHDMAKKKKKICCIKKTKQTKPTVVKKEDKLNTLGTHGDQHKAK